MKFPGRFSQAFYFFILYVIIIQLLHFESWWNISFYSKSHYSHSFDFLFNNNAVDLCYVQRCYNRAHATNKFVCINTVHLISIFDLRFQNICSGKIWSICDIVSDFTTDYKCNCNGMIIICTIVYWWCTF